MTRLLATIACAVSGFLVELAVWDGTTGLRWGGTVAPAALIAANLLGLAAGILTWVRPMTGFILANAISLVLVLAVPAWESFTAVFIALFALARLAPGPAARAGLVATVVPLSVNAWNAAGWTGPVTPASLAPVLVLWLVLAAGVWGVGRAMHRSSVRVRDLERSLDEAERAARVAERRAIARDLHDIVAHSVSGIILQAGGARALTEAARPAHDHTQTRVSAALGNIEDSAQQAMRELHRLVRTMREEGADQPGEGEQLPGLADIDSLIAHARSSGVQVQVRQTGEQRVLDPSIDLAAYRCVQESLANAMKHAGAGSLVRIAIAWGPELVLDVASVQASGHSPAGRHSGGFGLVGLSERLASVGGTLQAGPDDHGFRTVARIRLGG